MSTRVPITIEGNLVADPTFGESANGTKFAKFTVAVTDRKLEAGKWVAGDTQFHRTTAFGRTAENVKASLAKGDAVLVSGHLEFHHWTDESSGENRSATAVFADAIGPSLRYNRVEIERRPKAEGPDASATGPAVEQSPSAGASVSVA
jgi:single-strand DNA-binding protein